MSDGPQQPDTDLMYGVAAIAGHLGMTRKQVYHLHSTGHLPTFKIGGKVCARRSRLEAHFAQVERQAGREL